MGGQTKAIQEYQHDALNRLTVASEYAGSANFNLGCPDSGSAWCRQFAYDNSGNRTVPARSPAAGSNTWDAGSFNTKNQVADPGWVYDKAGNVIQSPVGQTMTYDGEGRMASFCSNSSCTQQTLFAYDAAGNRVQRTDQNGTTTFVYDAFGNLAAEYGGTPSATGTQYVTVDAMGSTRLVMEGAQASERHDFQPYGDELTTAEGTAGTWRTTALGYGPNNDTVRQKFTGVESDLPINPILSH